MPSRKALPYLALAAAVLALSITPFFIRWANAPGPVTVFFRVVAALVVLAPFFVRSIRREPLKVDRLTLLAPALGGLCMALDLISWSTGVQYTYVSTATLLGNTSPLWVALIAWLVFKEKLKSSFWIGMGLAFAGAVAVVGPDVFIRPDARMAIGDALGIASGLFYAGYLLAGQVGRRTSAAIRYLWLMNAASAVVMFVYIALRGWSFVDYSGKTWLIFLGAGLLAGVLGYYSVIYALGHLPASIVSPTLLIQPVLVSILGIPLVGEIFQPLQWAGAAAVLAGVYVIHRSRDTGKQADPARQVLPAQAD